MSMYESVTWECDSCGTEDRTDSRSLPRDWDEIGGKDLCEDCKIKYTCDDCNETQDSELTLEDTYGNPVCKECYEMNYQCASCGKGPMKLTEGMCTDCFGI